MRKTTWYISFLLILSSQYLLANTQAFNSYINQYKNIAIQEMQRTGVPASIKIAQGLLESNAGRSTLAQKANNHFGIKCGSKWKGKTYYRKDDDYRNGRLVKSCFRRYKRSTESYVAHSNFLTNNNRYKSLFSLNKKNYKAWAKGLKKAGYATSRTYDKKLIKLIEEYHLYKLDHSLPVGGYTPPPSSSPSSSSPTYTPPIALSKRDYSYINDVKMVYAKAGDTPYTIAKRLNTSAKKIIQYNEGIRHATEKLAVDTRVFVEKKKKSYSGRSKYHTVKQGESMYSISQIYGIRLDKLYQRNRMSKGMEPAVGVGIRLKGKARKRPLLRKKQYANAPKKMEPYKPVLVNNSTTTSPTPTTNPTSNQPTHQPTNIIEHIVQKGETLWRISQKYDLTVEELMRKNNLQSTTIHHGTILKIK